MQVRKISVVFFLMSLLATPAVARAQGSTATIAGVVRDQQNLPVPGATVTVSNTESSVSRSLVTAAEGDFNFPGMQPGDYLLTVELAGFAREQTPVRLEVNQRVRMDVVLKPIGLAQQIDVTTTVPLLHVSDAVVGEVIDQRQVAELPLNGRQFLELALLVPGAHTSHGAQMGDMSPLYWRPGQNSALTIAGARPNSNVYLLDGTVNTDPSFNTFVISLPPDAIREFQIQTGTYTAELGAGTGQINVVTWQPEYRVLQVRAQRAEQLQVRLSDFPGWTALVDGQAVPITRGALGNITLALPAGDHRVVLDFRSTPVRRVSNWVTVVAGGLWLVLFFRSPFFKLWRVDGTVGQTL